jgi:hypothetical protein
LTDEEMEKITKEWPTEFLVLVEKTDLSDLDIIRIPLVTQTEYDRPSNTKKKEELHDIESEEKNNTLEETTSESPAGGGGDEVNKEEEGEDNKQEEGKVTPLKDPLIEVRMSKKRNGSPH